MRISVSVLALLFYTYFGYPVIILLLGRIRNIKVHKIQFEPKVTVIVAAYNEEKYIKNKLMNALELDYPADRLEVLMISDGSTDNTINLAHSINNPSLRVFEQKRSGKAAALNFALSEAAGDFLLFTDANVFFNKDSLRHMVALLGDPNIGAVTGKVNLVALDTSEPLGEGVYMRYERFLQKYETMFSSVVGTDGGMFLAKRDLVDKIPDDTILDDFYIVMRIILKGKRVVYTEEAVADEYVPASIVQEFKRKSRIAAGGFQVLARLPKLLVFVSNYRFLFQFYSHKLLRWLAPLMLIILYISTFPSANNDYGLVLFVSQNIFYAMAILGRLSPRLRRMNVFYLCYYFTAMNLAVLVGMIKAITKTQAVTWQRVNR